MRLRLWQTTVVLGQGNGAEGGEGLIVRGKVDVQGSDIVDYISLAVRCALYSPAGRAGALYIYSLIKVGMS